MVVESVISWEKCPGWCRRSLKGARVSFSWRNLQIHHSVLLQSEIEEGGRGRGSRECGRGGELGDNMNSGHIWTSHFAFTEFILIFQSASDFASYCVAQALRVIRAPSSA